MSRRVSMPAADDLFRPTSPAGRPGTGEPKPVEHKSVEPRAEAAVRAVPDEPEADVDGTDARGRGGSARRPSGRVRHDEKMTVYVTSDELLDLEHARLSLRRAHGLAVDRGRLVREAVAMVLEDFEAHGQDSALVRRLTQE
ncbi:hypothetical protein [Nocardioides ungokensis]|uniref:hypothetical protein n=1 Tax=Nocardioides ungokensis TaxID=1643322 RepID=UPI0015DDAD01|nr:hypothetical protein [Nocardioides ungokensis]